MRPCAALACTGFDEHVASPPIDCRGQPRQHSTCRGLCQVRQYRQEGSAAASPGQQGAPGTCSDNWVESRMQAVLTHTGVHLAKEGQVDAAAAQGRRAPGREVLGKEACQARESECAMCRYPTCSVCSTTPQSAPEAGGTGQSKIHRSHAAVTHMLLCNDSLLLGSGGAPAKRMCSRRPPQSKG